MENIISLISRSIAVLLLIILLPFLLIISFITLIFDGSPILYKQNRIGHRFVKFRLYKFRTMKNNDMKIDISINNRNQITKWGNILRNTKIDEIPQLLNIIKGDMRFIGPRPEIPKYFNESSFAFLNKIKPGISDYASIILRNEDKILERIGGENPYLVLLPIKIELAKYYVEKKSFFLDLKLVFITIISLISPNYSSSVLIMPRLIKDLPRIKDFLYKFVY